MSRQGAIRPNRGILRANWPMENAQDHGFDPYFPNNSCMPALIQRIIQGVFVNDKVLALRRAIAAGGLSEPRQPFTVREGVTQ